MARQLSGKEAAAAVNGRTRKAVDFLKEKGVQPCLHILRAGENKSDLSYEKSLVKNCQSLGIVCEREAFPADISQKELLEAIDRANRAEHVHGILLFRPLPPQVDSSLAENAVAPAKDVDGMTAASMAGVFTGSGTGFPPCTPQACMEILDYYQIDCKGKKAAVVGRSLVVGRPAAMMLLQKDATVTICHTKTKDMRAIVKEADIVIAAAGCAKLLDEAYFTPGQIVLDVGIHVDSRGKMCGDVDDAAAEPIVEAITPVPGGVGSVTASVLLAHVAEAAERKRNLG